MKRLSLLSIILLTIISACKNDDELEVDNALKQTWVATYFSKSGCDNENNNFEEDKVCDDENCLKLTLKADNTYERKEVINGVSRIETGDWIIDEEEIRFSFEEEEEVFYSRRTFTVTATTLTLETLVESTSCLELTEYVVSSDTTGS
ncbi:MAG: hypothetical protein JXQ90_10185 [Cyclobacteriaceae bacterium]